MMRPCTAVHVYQRCHSSQFLVRLLHPFFTLDLRLNLLAREDVVFEKDADTSVVADRRIVAQGRCESVISSV